MGGAAAPGWAEEGDPPGADDGAPDSMALVAAEVASVGIERESGAPIALLREQDGGRFIPISIGFAEARAIAWALAGVEMPRPMTHDLMASLIDSAGFRVERIVVHSLRDHTYLARIEGRRAADDEPLVEVDSRPSDAMALALRIDAPIFVSEELLISIPQFDFFPGEPDEQVLRVLGATVVRARDEDLSAAGLEPGTAALRVVAAGGGEDLLRAGDLILKADGVALVDPETLLNVVRGKERDDEVLLEVWRDGERIELKMPALPELRPTARDPGTMAALF